MQVRPALALLCIGAFPAAAQHPAIGSVSGPSIVLQSGFPHAPSERVVAAGGTLAAAKLGGSCEGFMIGPPDPGPDFSKSLSAPLTITVHAALDICLGFSARFAPTVLPAFHTGRLLVAVSVAGVSKIVLP